MTRIDETEAAYWLQKAESSERAVRARALFFGGYNCAQAVALAFSDLIDMDEKLLAQALSSFGGGLGRMREVCGTVSGMSFVAGALYGYDDPAASQEKAEHYARIQQLAGTFAAVNGSIICRELLGLSKPGASEPTPEKRTEEYYKKRPCDQLVAIAAAILEEYRLPSSAGTAGQHQAVSADR